MELPLPLTAGCSSPKPPLPSWQPFAAPVFLGWVSNGNHRETAKGVPAPYGSSKVPGLVNST
eukprot:scaffold270318_cov14-Tisochrysis_lutea.AAC.2